MAVFKDKNEIKKQWDFFNQEVLKLTVDKRLEEALRKAEALYQFSKKYFGKKSEQFAVSVNNLGYIYFLLGNFDKSESYLLYALELSEHVYGKESEETAAINANLANLYKMKSSRLFTKLNKS